MNRKKAVKPPFPVKDPVSEKTEMELLLRKIRALCIQSPDKAAIILSGWLEKVSKAA